MRVLIFGASSVQGYWDSQGGWADRLKRYYDDLQIASFKNKDFSREQPKIMNLGISGDSTRELLKRIEPETKARQNAKGVSFIIQIGSNNAAVENGKPKSTPEEYQADLKKLIEECQKFSNKILVVGFKAVDEKLTNPIAWANLCYTNENILRFEKAAMETCHEMGVSFVAVFDEYKKQMDQGLGVQAHDGLHPNDAGHELIFKLVQPKLDELLRA